MKIMFNEDWTHFISTRMEHEDELSEKYLKDFIYQYKNTQITDFAMNVNGTVSTFPAKTRESFCDKYFAEEENGVKVDYKNTFARTAYKLFCEKKLDMYKIWIETLREIGVRPWISIRMNDVHGDYFETSLVKSKYVSDNPSLWRIRHRNADGYFDKAFDFALQKVQDDILSYIDEALSTYRPDGLELDFTRENLLFCPGFEKRGEQILDSLMEKIYDLCRKYPDKDGKTLPINLLVNGTVNANLKLGLNVNSWCRKGYISSVAILPRWRTINTDYETEVWRMALGDGVLLGGGQQLLVKPSVEQYLQGSDAISDMEMAFGQACVNLSGGCDFVYLYNYMDLCEKGIDELYYKGSLRDAECLKKILNNVGEIETAEKFKRRHTLTFDDFALPWDKEHSALPVEFKDDSVRTIKINTGRIPKNAKVYLVLAFENDIDVNNFEVYSNCKRAVYLQRGGLDRNIIDKDGYIFEMKNSWQSDGYFVYEMRLFEKAKLIYAETVVCPEGTNVNV